MHTVAPSAAARDAAQPPQPRPQAGSAAEDVGGAALLALAGIGGAPPPSEPKAAKRKRGGPEKAPKPGPLPNAKALIGREVSIKFHGCEEAHHGKVVHYLPERGLHQIIWRDFDWSDVELVEDDEDGFYDLLRGDEYERLHGEGTPAFDPKDVVWPAPAVKDPAKNQRKGWVVGVKWPAMNRFFQGKIIEERCAGPFHFVFVRYKDGAGEWLNPTKKSEDRRLAFVRADEVVPAEEAKWADQLGKEGLRKHLDEKKELDDAKRANGGEEPEEPDPQAAAAWRTVPRRTKQPRPGFAPPPGPVQTTAEAAAGAVGAKRTRSEDTEMTEDNRSNRLRTLRPRTPNSGVKQQEQLLRAADGERGDEHPPAARHGGVHQV